MSARISLPNGHLPPKNAAHLPVEQALDELLALELLGALAGVALVVDDQALDRDGPLARRQEPGVGRGRRDGEEEPDADDCVRREGEVERSVQCINRVESGESEGTHSS